MDGWHEEIAIAVIALLVGSVLTGLAARVANLAGRVKALEVLADLAERIARLETIVDRLSRNRDD